MTERFKDYISYLAIAVFLFLFERFLGGDYLEKNLLNNQLVILITIFAISSATNSIILTKLKDLSDEYMPDNFEDVLREVSTSFKEQIVYIFLTLFLSIALFAATEPFENFKEVVTVGMLTVFVAAIDNLWDSNKASFILLGFGVNKD